MIRIVFGIWQGMLFATMTDVIWLFVVFAVLGALFLELLISKIESK